MNKGFAVVIGTVSPGRVDGSQMSKNMANKMNHKGLGKVLTCTQKPRERSLSTVTTSVVAPRTHQRRWSADICKCEVSNVIIVRKNRTEPQPPQRGVSLLRTHSVSPSSFKRYSCPPIGIFPSPSRSSSCSSSSCSSSTTPSCSSPPPVQTSVITGPDPLGWKLHPKSSSTSLRTRTNRLSLQIPLPVILPDPKSNPTPITPSDNTSDPDPSHKTKPPVRPKPSRRRHSDSSAFLRSLATPVVPVVTLEELCAVHLHSVTRSNESDDVFSHGNQGQRKATSQSHKIPPPVPKKTSMARQIAQLIAHSRQLFKPIPIKAKETTYTRAIKPHQAADLNRLHATKTGLRLDTSCDRERLTPRLPGREI
ncbi:mucin-5AC-like isoform X2 [Anabas testudineus]|uniref:mucin-5AC-like isoform X2 n=1 Tax=Anabas testudineus TaxID=64144 RepID=UPI000E459D4A|nr:mucin-5AC-like isoform X2 [Anabas testudineus]